MATPKPDFEWRLRLFASVDLTNSTAFKNYAPDGWANLFCEFFEEFPRALEDAFAQRYSNTPGCPTSAMRVWKYQGDEILLEAELKDRRAAKYHVAALVESLSRYTDVLRDKWQKIINEQGGDKWKRLLPPLGLKGTAWTAGFPVENRQFDLRYPHSDDQVVRDFLGPGVDLGFRLASFADRRRIPINLQLALLLVNSTFSPASDSNGVVLSYEKSAVLKGVAGGAPYPIIWIDRARGSQSKEDELLGTDLRRNLMHLRSFVDDRLDALSDFVRCPFIVSDEEIKHVPAEFQARRLALMASYPETSLQTDQEQAQASQVTGAKPRLPDPPPKEREHEIE